MPVASRLDIEMMRCVGIRASSLQNYGDISLHLDTVMWFASGWLATDGLRISGSQTGTFLL